MSCYDAARLCCMKDHSWLLICSFLHRDLNDFLSTTRNDAMAALLRIFEGNAIKLNKILGQTGRTLSIERISAASGDPAADTLHPETSGSNSHADKAGQRNHGSSNGLSRHMSAAFQRQR